MCTIRQVIANEVRADALDLGSPPAENGINDLLCMSLRNNAKRVQCLIKYAVNTGAQMIG